MFYLANRNVNLPNSIEIRLITKMGIMVLRIPDHFSVSFTVVE